MLPSTWNVTPVEAIKLQKELRANIRLVPLAKPTAVIGGADVSMNRFATEGFAGIVSLTFETLEMIDHAVIKDMLAFPYIPGLLSFREIPLLLQAWEKLATKPDVLVVDGIGIAHPRRLGIATHLGLLLNVPTIGCAKSVLTGIYEEPAPEAGSLSYLYDRYNKTEIIGAVLRTKTKVKPIFISPGHLITLEESVALLRQCVRGYRIPEPTRSAHTTVNDYRRRNTETK